MDISVCSTGSFMGVLRLFGRVTKIGATPNLPKHGISVKLDRLTKATEVQSLGFFIIENKTARYIKHILVQSAGGIQHLRRV